MRDRDVAEIAAAAADDEHVALQKKAKGLKKKVRMTLIYFIRALPHFLILIIISKSGKEAHER